MEEEDDMVKKIDKRIVDYSVAKVVPPAGTESGPPPPSVGRVVQMHEKLMRPEMLLGATYKITTPHSEHALYVTINDIVLNPGTPHELRRPFEMFINSKSMEHFQWIVALTRIVSAVFRKGGDVTFLVEELRSVFDPKGGYFRKGGRYVPSLVAEIGDVLEHHLRMIGLLRDEDRGSISRQTSSQGSNDGAGFPANAVLCPKCLTKAMVKMENCLTCLNCGESKCG
jgi:hypothetical protein